MDIYASASFNQFMTLSPRSSSVVVSSSHSWKLDRIRAGSSIFKTAFSFPNAFRRFVAQKSLATPPVVLISYTRPSSKKLGSKKSSRPSKARIGADAAITPSHMSG